MPAKRPSRRDVLRTAAGTIAAGMVASPAISQRSAARVVVIGGGFAGASCTRALKQAGAPLSVTLVEANATFTALPLVNAVLAGLRPIQAQRFGYDWIAGAGVTLIHQRAVAVDASTRIVTLADRGTLGYDRLIIAPGIDFRMQALRGYDAAAAGTMPHAWANGGEIIALRSQLEAMRDGGVVVISVPVTPARCPPGPYERASMIAWYLKLQKPRSKIILLDAKDAFTMQRQFQSAWAALYPGLIEWVGLSHGGNVTSVEPATKTFVTDFDRIKADVANVIPPQRAGDIARVAGVADRTGWCPVDATTFESTIQPGIHVIGDAAIAGALPKSASAASAEGRICARAIARLMAGEMPEAPRLESNCYSLIAPDYAISIAGAYRPVNGQFMEIDGTGATSPIDAPRATRVQEADAADRWFKRTLGEIFG